MQRRCRAMLSSAAAAAVEADEVQEALPQLLFLPPPLLGAAALAGQPGWSCHQLRDDDALLLHLRKAPAAGGLQAVRLRQGMAGSGARTRGQAPTGLGCAAPRAKLWPWLCVLEEGPLQAPV